MNVREISFCLILISVVVSIKGQDGFIASACYGVDPDCVFYNMSCGASQVIKLNTLYAGYKNNPICADQTQHCSSADTCCVYNAADSTDLFTLENTYKAYVNCSGKTICQNVRAPWQLMEITTGDFRTSTYVTMEYDCELTSRITNMCGGSSKLIELTNNDTQIMFDGSTESYDPAGADKECKCTITNQLQRQMTLTITLFDVRTQSFYIPDADVYAQCSSATLTFDGFALRCTNTTQPYIHNFRYFNLPNSDTQRSINVPAGRTTEISLANIFKEGINDAPAMVWIRVSSADQFQIRCEESKFTTTTTSTTPKTTTITTTTTTTTPPTTPQPTTPQPTTPQPTTPQPTTPQPTTTTTTTQQPTTPQPTTPKPTTQQPTTPQPTTPQPTTEQPTTPKPTTQSPTTPKPTTPEPTTAQPQTSKQTSKTTVPPTTQQPTTKAPTTKEPTSPTPTTPQPTIVPPTTQQPITPQPTTQQPTTDTPNGAPSNQDGGDTHEAAVMLAIFIPIAAFIVLVVIFAFWVYFKRTRSKRPLTLKLMKNGTATTDVYKKFTNPGILDDFIKDNGRSSVYSQSKSQSPLTTHITVPKSSIPATDLYATVQPKGSVRLPQTTQYVPATVIKSVPNGRPISAPNGRPASITTGPKNVTYVHLERANGAPPSKQPVGGFSSVYDPSSDPTFKPNSILKSRNSDPVRQVQETPKKSSIKTDQAAGPIVIHIDNVSTPRSSSTPGTMSPVTSTAGSTKQRNTPRDSSPSISSRQSISSSEDGHNSDEKLTKL